MKITLDIEKVVVHQNENDSDLVRFFLVGVPDPCWPYKEGQTSLDTRAAQGHGAEWVEEHFGIDAEVTRDYGDVLKDFGPEEEKTEKSA
jgi:hypothetical protein